MQLSLLIHAANIGFMIMFSAVVAPAVFKVLSQKAAGAYLRVLFPRMFIFGCITSSLATVTAFFENNLAVVAISGGIAIGFLVNAFIITPQINKYRDTMMNGDQSANAMCGRPHLVSVAVSLAQLLASFYAIVTSTIW